jgi:3-oxoacyl-[acyl-carrier protein] reductase/meso-butanediol dehydrogenase/(S,S)-butanediol dehydrogenase/diacetyl reductase
MTQKVIVITGGNKGIGRSIVDQFISAGYHVIIGSRTKIGIEGLAPAQFTHIMMDVRDELAHKNLCSVASKMFGRLDAYINNAGLSAWMPINKIDGLFFDQLMDVNLKGAFWGCKAAAETMAKTGGTIINISSIAAKRGSVNNSMYCATKFGMNGLTQSLAKELGPRNIRVNAICPVLVETDGLLEALRSEYAPGNGKPEKFLAGFKDSNSALGRLPTGVDVGNMAVFLASDEASGMTGQCVNVDCGVFPQ